MSNSQAQAVSHFIYSTTAAARAAAWDRDDPAELRRAADEWAALGYYRYADYLRAYADGERPPAVRRPW